MSFIRRTAKFIAILQKQNHQCPILAEEGNDPAKIKNLQSETCLFTLQLLPYKHFIIYLSFCSGRNTIPIQWSGSFP